MPIKSQNSYEERGKEKKIQPKSCITKKACAIFILLLAIVAMIAIISSIFVFRRPQGSALVGQYKFQHMPGTFLILQKKLPIFYIIIHPWTGEDLILKIDVGYQTIW